MYCHGLRALSMPKPMKAVVSKNAVRSLESPEKSTVKAAQKDRPKQ